MSGRSQVEFARRAHLDHLVQTDPRAALDDARRWMADEPDDVVVKALGWGAIGRALFELGDMARAGDAMRRASGHAAEADIDDIVVAISLSAAAVLAESGDIDDALAQLARIARPPDAAAHGRIETQFAYVLHHAGRLPEALEHATRAESLLAGGVDELGQLRVLLVRGLIRLQQGRLDVAEQDFLLADRLATRLDQTATRAMIASNLGVVHGRARRLQDSVRQFSSAADLYARCGEPGRAVAIMEIDRAETLMHGGLLSDALASATRAVRYATSMQNRVVLGDGLLLLATVELARGRAAQATRGAEAAVREFGASGRREMVAHARAVGVRARLSQASATTAMAGLDDASALIAELAASGWDQVAHDLRLERVRVGFAMGLVGEVADDLRTLRLGVSSEQRATALSGWYGEAVALALDGDPHAALDACRSGLSLLDDIVSEAPTLERRSAAMRLGNDLSRLTIELAVGLGDAETVFSAAEGTRARALHEELADQRRHRPLTDEGADQLRRELTARLGERVLVEWVVSRDAVLAVVLDAAGSRLVEVCGTNELRRASDHALVWLDLAANEPDASSVRAMRSAALLDDLLIEPLGLPAEVGVVMVPVGVLHGIPWSGLPRLAARSFALAPNAQVWLEADRRAAASVHSVGLVVGPEVPNASIERSAVERIHPGAAVAAGAGAGASTVRSMFGGLDLVHVAAHGTFRSDHPLLSTLRLDDGEATLYDAVPDRVQTRLVVLSSCEGGAQGTADGSEVLGLSAVMLARGAASVLAPLTVVRDLECADFVAEVHGELAAGEPFACAVAAVRNRWLGDDDLSRWAVASSFTCFGSGAVTMAEAQNAP